MNFQPHRSDLQSEMKFRLLLLLVVCWVNAAPNSKLHRILQRIGAASPHHGGYSILGSKTTSIKKYPFNAAVLTSDNSLLGGGFIYNKQWIVTAGWNTYDQTVSSLAVRVGSDNALKGTQFFELSKIILHPNYTAADWDWNVSCLKLKKEIKFNVKAKAIKVSKTTPKKKSQGTVTGWGIKSYVSENADSDKLQELIIDIYDRVTCMHKWWGNHTLNPRLYCAYKSDRGPCSLDVGDPLVQKNQVVGMYLGGHLCAIDNHPGLYSDMAKFEPWIEETINKNSDPSELDDSDVQYFGEENDDDDDEDSDSEEDDDNEDE